ncbi:MAG: hypothetical protein IKX86_02235 [Clostridia bacterium]|nr:hypothetical protein [Clostridia bacterium]
MKELSEYRDEIFRRGKERKEKKKKTAAALVSVFSAVIILSAIPSAALIAKKAATRDGGKEAGKGSGMLAPSEEAYSVDSSDGSDLYEELPGFLSELTGSSETRVYGWGGKSDNLEENDAIAESGHGVSISMYAGNASSSDGRTVFRISGGDLAGEYVLSGNVLTLPDGRTVALAPEELAELNSILKKLG